MIEAALRLGAKLVSTDLTYIISILLRRFDYLSGAESLSSLAPPDLKTFGP